MQLSAALSYLHSRAVEGSFVVHRDLKPENIAFSPDGRLKLFGEVFFYFIFPTSATIRAVRITVLGYFFCIVWTFLTAAVQRSATFYTGGSTRVKTMKLFTSTVVLKHYFF